MGLPGIAKNKTRRGKVRKERKRKGKKRANMTGMPGRARPMTRPRRLTATQEWGGNAGLLAFPVTNARPHLDGRHRGA